MTSESREADWSLRFGAEPSAPGDGRGRDRTRTRYPSSERNRVAKFESSSKGKMGATLVQRPKAITKETLALSFRLIGIFGKISQQLKEFIRLSDEQTHRSEKLDYSHGDSLGLSRTNDRTAREFAA